MTGPIQIKADFGDMKRALRDDKYHRAFSKGMFEAAVTIMEATKKVAPDFSDWIPPQRFGFTPGHEPGTFKKSIKVVPMGLVMLVVGNAIPADVVLKGHDVLSTPGQRKWFFSHYPLGYYRKSPGPRGSPVPPNRFPEKIGAISVPVLVAIVTYEIEKAIKE